ncbi:MAG: FAD-binding oxidoreductase [Burkholderiales bacterium]|jgi:FAD/FMN-containing dehydrogenase/Fe-S oxidoreductase|nr:FAD-binding oxidoreductase [Burkholderiales bacterium]
MTARPITLAADAVSALEADLRQVIEGEVRFDRGTRAVYAADASNYRQVPIGVVVPRTVADMVWAVKICARRGVPILPRGGGTSQNGQCVNVAVVIDTSKHLNRVVSVDPAARTAIVEPGTVCDTLRDAAEKHRLTFAPDPATHSRCTLGGMIGNNSCGPHSVMAGKTVENIEALEVLTGDGERFWVGSTSDEELAAIIRGGGRRGEIYAGLARLRDRYADLIRAKFPKIKRRVSGYNLDQLLPENGFNVARALVGSEGSCALTLAAKTKLVASPPHRVIVVLGWPDIYIAGDHAVEVLSFGPIACEGLDIAIIGGLKSRGLRLDDIALLPPGEAWLMVEFGGDTSEEAVARAQRLVHHYAGRVGAPSTLVVADRKLQQRIWSIRETGASATALSREAGRPDPVVGWEDAAVDPARLGDYLREFQALVDRHGYRTSLYGHFGDGCIHARITFDLASPQGVAVWRGFLEDAARLVVKFGGSLSGEHGDGQAKAEFLPIMYGPELMEAFREFKRVWDPRGLMNPGKLVDPYRADENLRLGPDYRPLTPGTRMSFLSPEGDGFTRAVERCIGMGKCRSGAGGTMCPSYRATGEERYSTRGRARLLSEMLRGEVIDNAWQSDEVREALELCLSCKGCRSDCPTHVDMAAYKAEFFSHYYEGKLRPLHAYSTGLIGRWAGIAGAMPALSNFVTQAPGLNALAKKLAGIAPQRNLPTFASETFRHWFGRRAPPRTVPLREGQRQAPAASRVLYWPDTFANFFHPEIPRAAVEVLEAAGCDVSIPAKRLCCGRPLYDHGFLDLAKRELAAVLDALAGEIAAGTPLVGTEPTCIAVFRDELARLFPHDERAQRLAAQTFTFAEYLERIGFEPPRAAGRALLHGHCHQKSLWGLAADTRLLESMGYEVAAPDTGCCGMAGSFGFHPDRYALSMQIGELAVFPAVRAAADDAVIVNNAYSCREHLAGGTGRRTTHIAELVRRALP